jgi:WD40 repeat protein
MDISFPKRMAIIICITLSCAGCSTPSEAPAAMDGEGEPTHTAAIQELTTATQRPGGTPTPLPTVHSSREIGLETVKWVVPLIEIQEESGWVYNLAFSPDGTLLAGAADHNAVNVWRVEDGVMRRSLTGHTARVRSVAFSSDGRLFASGSEDGTVHIWKVSDWSQLWTLKGHTSFVNSLDFSPDGQRLVSGGEDRLIMVWEVESGELLYSLEETILRVEQVAFSPDGALIAAVSAENRARVWRAEGGELLWTLLGPNPIYRIAFSPDNTTLATGAWSVSSETGAAMGPIIFWNLLDGSQSGRTEEMTVAYSLAYSPDGAVIFSGTKGNNSLHVWRASDGALLWELKGHEDDVVAVGVNRDGTRIASADQSGRILIWGLPED